MKLDYNEYLKGNMGEIVIPQSDIEKYGLVIGTSFRGYSSAPGKTYFYKSTDGKTYVTALSEDGQGSALVDFLGCS